MSKKAKKNTDFVRVYDAECSRYTGFKIEAGMKIKDLPRFFHSMFEHVEGWLQPIRFRDGQFYAINWVQENPSYWPDAIESWISPGDYIIALDDGGMRHIPNYSKTPFAGTRADA